MLEAARFGQAGIDEAGRGPLAGPVVASAVLLPDGYTHPLINDSKQLTHEQRIEAAEIIRRDAVCYAIAEASPEEIDQINILQATMLAMHRAIALLNEAPAQFLIDGNYFRTKLSNPWQCVKKGDSIHTAIAAASILAKVHRDELMRGLDISFPQYGWSSNKGYPTPFHRRAVAEYGLSPHHRSSFCTRALQGELFEEDSADS